MITPYGWGHNSNHTRGTPKGSCVIGMPDVGSRSEVPSVALPPYSARYSTFRKDTLRDHALAAWVSALVRLGHDWGPLRAETTHTQKRTQAQPKRAAARPPFAAVPKAQAPDADVSPEKISDSRPDDAEGSVLFCTDRGWLMHDTARDCLLRCAPR